MQGSDELQNRKPGETWGVVYMNPETEQAAREAEQVSREALAEDENA